ncbi:hypothetical protein EVAR_103117_1 [Eumeta japonica]|uniref:Uncharacterized protein n=1 Tax=Eumeta variegata TaxID=151549 RepID=A0A4C1X568_EUMVA|nr:hypothetical protein EVAR_103117_1 [Eumeta japonica]
MCCIFMDARWLVFGVIKVVIDERCRLGATTHRFFSIADISTAGWSGIKLARRQQRVVPDAVGGLGRLIGSSQNSVSGNMPTAWIKTAKRNGFLTKPPVKPFHGKGSGRTGMFGRNRSNGCGFEQRPIAALRSSINPPLSAREIVNRCVNKFQATDAAPTLGMVTARAHQLLWLMKITFRSNAN